MAKYTICTNKRGHEERSLYTDPEGRKYLRLRENGQNSMVSLGTTSLDKAVKIRDEHRGVKTAVKLGMPLSAPQDAARRAKTSVAAVIRRYEADGYPGKRGGKRNAGKHCDGEEARCKVLAEYFNGTAAAEDLDQDGLDAYRTWRCAKVSEGKVKLDGNQSKPKGAGDRTTDLDLNCLNNAYRWGLRKKLIKTNPIEKRAKYHAPSEVTHCREYAPESPEELHAAAGVLFSSRRSESLGWQLLIEGMTGLRSDEAVHLRMNARATEAGGLTPDGRNMCVRRAKKSSKFNVNVRVHPGLEAVLAAHRIWHAARYPLSPWYFPGRNRLALKHIDKSALTHALNHLFQKGQLPRKYTSHGGGRAFYVYARRSQGADDPQICYEINHVGGVGTLEQVYALPAKHWQNGEAPGMDWLPKEAPAWSKIKNVNFSSLDGANGPTSFEI